MSNEPEQYIGSVSPTIGVKEQRQLLEMQRTMNALLTQEEYVKIMAVYGSAIDRVFKENGMEEETK